MKREYFYILGLLAIIVYGIGCSNSAFAQELSVGIRGGGNISKISKVIYKNHFKPGFHLGFYTKYEPYGSSLSFTNEVIFSMKGIALTLPDSLLMDDKSKLVNSMNYIDLPFLINFHAGDYLLLSAGIQPSFYTYMKDPRGSVIPYSKEYGNIIDISMVLGAGYMLNDHYGFGVRYNKSFVPAFASDDAGGGKTHLVQLYMLYELGSRKIKW